MAQTAAPALAVLPWRRRIGAWWIHARPYALVLGAYLLLVAITDARFMGDTVWYALQIRGQRLWEAGHLLWRPLGWLLWQLAGPLTSRFVGPGALHNLVFLLVAVNWLAGLVSVASLYGLLRRVSSNSWVTYGVCLGFICAQGFLNYTQTGSSYSVSLALLLLGLYLLARGAETARGAGWAVAAGAALAGSVCMWLPFVLALPGAVASPLLLYRRDRRRLLLALQAAIVCAVLVAGVYLLAIWQLGITSLPALKAWLSEASHGSTTGGFPRMVFGFARSFVNMGNDGVLFKRYLVNDIYNPVSLGELVTVSLWKLMLFYLFLLAVVVQLARARARWGMLAFFALSCAPVLALAVYWQGGDMERYLALYPALFIGVACALSAAPPLPVLRPVIGLFLVVMVVTNVGVLSKIAQTQRQAQAIERLGGVLPQMRPGSVVVTLNQQDELWQFNHSFPFHPLFRQHGEFVFALNTTNWRERFAAKMLQTWRNGGEVWISVRMLSARPQGDWNWVEGDDRRRLWTDINGFFTQFDYGPAPHDDDGFVLLTRSARNEQLLDALARRLSALE